MGAAPRGLRNRAVFLANRTGEQLVRWLDRYLGRRSLVGDRAFFDPSDFPWVAEVERRAEAIRAELDDVLADLDHLPNFQDISIDQYALTQDDCWKTYFFAGYGFEVAEHLRRCPETAAALRVIPGMTTAMFSILAPGKRIPPHGGPYKGVLRYHLALRVPEPRAASGITVRGETRHWEPGRSLIFDDVWEHEAWNGTDEIRVVLFVDFVRPLRPVARLVNAVVLKAIAWSPFVQDGKARHRDWEQRFETIRAGAR